MKEAVSQLNNGQCLGMFPLSFWSPTCSTLNQKYDLILSLTTILSFCGTSTQPQPL